MVNELQLPEGWKRIKSLSRSEPEEDINLTSATPEGPKTELPEGWRRVAKFSERKEPEAETYGQAGLRHLARSGSRVVETVAGLPKSIMNLAEGAYNLIPESVREFGKDESQYGIPGVTPTNLLGKTWETVSNLLPSTEGTRKNIGTAAEALGAPKGYLEPKNLEERTADDLVSDFATFLTPIPGTGAAKLGKTLGKSAWRVIPANMGSYLTKKFTGSEAGGDAVRTGTYLMSSLVGGIKGAKKIDLAKEKDMAYDLAEKALKPGERFNSSNVLKAVEKLEKDFIRLGYEDLSSKKKLSGFINSLKGKAVEPRKIKPAAAPFTPSKVLDSSGYPHNTAFGIPPKQAPTPKLKPQKQTIDAKELWQFKKETSDVFDFLEKDTEAAKHLTEFRKVLNDTLKNQKENPAFGAALTEADYLNTAVKEIKKINAFAENVLGGEHARYAFGREFLKNPKRAMRNALIARGITGVMTQGEEGRIILDLMNKSPKMKSAYTGMLHAAAKEEGPKLLKQAAKFFDASMKSLDTLR